MFGNLKWMGQWPVIFVAIGLFCSSAAPAKKPPKPPGDDSTRTSYTIVQLDVEDDAGVWDCYAHGVNNVGDVVGRVRDPATDQMAAAHWAVGGSGEDVQSELRTLIGGLVAEGVNDAGEIVGSGHDANGNNLGLYWADALAPPLPLPPVTGDANSGALAINNQGVACGWSWGDEGRRAVAWRINRIDGEAAVRGPVVLTPQNQIGAAWAINNNDAEGCARIVGQFGAGDPTAAVAWTVQSLSDGSLTLVGTTVVEDGRAAAFGVNNGGTICGDVGWPLEAVVWTDIGSLILHCIKDAPVNTAQDVNNAGVIVGWGGHGVGWCEAVAWPNADARMVLLSKFLGRNSPFFLLVEATAVNDVGAVVGYGIVGANGVPDAAFLAIPE